jgi:O-antigen/teichoic acid export membrane protein
MVGRMRALAFASGAYLTGSAVGQGLAVLLFPLYTRYLTPSEYGILGVTVAVSTLLGTVFALSLPGTVGRLYFEAESDEERRRLYGTVLAFMVVGPGLLALGVHVAGMLGVLDMFESVPYTPYLQYAVAIAYVSIFLQLPIFIYQARQEPRTVVVLSVLNAGFIAGAMVIFIVVLDQGVLGALRGQLAGAGAIALVAIAVTARISSFHLSWRWLAAALAFGLPLVPHLVGQWVLWLSDRVILDHFVSAAQLGLYSIGYTLGLAASFLSLAMAGAFGPEIMKSLKRDTERAAVPRIGTYWVLALCWCCTALALIGVDALLTLAPSEFHGAAEVIPWIVFGYLAFGLYTVLTQGTWFSMRTRMVPVLTFVAAALNVGLNLVLIPIWGIIGSAVATLLAFTALAAMQGVLSSRLHHVPWEYRRWATILAASLGTFAFAVLLRPDPMVARLGVEAAALIIVFPAILTVLRFWRPDEVAFISGRARVLRQGT